MRNTVKICSPEFDKGVCNTNKRCTQIHTNSHDTLQVVLSGSHMERGVPVNVDGAEVAAGLQQSLGQVVTARESGPVHTHVLLLNTHVLDRALQSPEA